MDSEPSIGTDDDTYNKSVISAITDFSERDELPLVEMEDSDRESPKLKARLKANKKPLIGVTSFIVICSLGAIISFALAFVLLEDPYEELLISEGVSTEYEPCERGSDELEKQALALGAESTTQSPDVYGNRSTTQDPNAPGGANNASSKTQRPGIYGNISTTQDPNAPGGANNASSTSSNVSTTTSDPNATGGQSVTGDSTDDGNSITTKTNPVNGKTTTKKPPVPSGRGTPGPIDSSSSSSSTSKPPTIAPVNYNHTGWNVTYYYQEGLCKRRKSFEGLCARSSGLCRLDIPFAYLP